MSRITIAPDASGTAVFTVASPATNTSRVVTLPDATTTLVGTDATQTLTNKTLTAPVITGGSLSGTSGTLTLGTAQATTSGTAIDFTGIPSWAKRITVMFGGVSTNGTSLKQVQLGSGSFTTSGYSGGGGAISSGSAGGSSSTTGLLAGVFTLASDAFSGNMIITNLTGNSWVASFSGGSATGNLGSVSGGSVTIGGVLDRIRITTVNGTDTFDAGSINIMYEG